MCLIFVHAIEEIDSLVAMVTLPTFIVISISYFWYLWSFSWQTYRSFRRVSWSQYRSFVVVSDRTPITLCELHITLSVFCGNFWLQYLYFMGVSVVSAVFVKDLCPLFGESSCCYSSFQTCYWCYVFYSEFLWCCY